MAYRRGEWGPHYVKATPWAKRHPEKIAAQRLVQKAVRTGQIKKPKRCEVCRHPRRDDIVGHHDDYSQPLKVRWLCSQCHSDAHKAERFPGGKAPWRPKKHKVEMTAADLGL